MARPLEAGEQFLPAEVFKLARELRHAIDCELEPCGVTTQQAALMLVARLHGSCGPGQLAHPLGTDTAGTTRLVDRLETKGLVARQSSTTDRRAVLVQLTPAGHELTPTLIEAFKRAQRKLLEGLEESDVEQFWSMVRRLRQKVRAGDCKGAES